MSTFSTGPGTAATNLGVEFTRHARNRLRLYGVTEHAVVQALADSVRASKDDRGNHMHTATIEQRRVTIVVAADHPNLIITIYPS